jgi:predicted heme/steroid binding protein
MSYLSLSILFDFISTNRNSFFKHFGGTLMKKLILILSISLILFGCSTTTPNEPSTPSPEENSVVETELLELTLEELAEFDGKDGRKAYVAVDGDIYDVTGNRKWLNGEHEQGMTAGKDLSEFISSAPHGKDILKQFTIVGKLVE